MKDILDPMPWGQYKDELIGTIIEQDAAYIEWAIAEKGLRLNDAATRYLRECQS